MKGAWRLIMTPPAERALSLLPEKAVPAIIETFAAVAGNPQRLGKPMQRELEGHWVARRGPYRIIYRIDDDLGAVVIVAVGHRADVYRRR